MIKLRPSEVNNSYSSRSVWLHKAPLYIMVLVCIQISLMSGVDNSAKQRPRSEGPISNPIEVFQAWAGNGFNGWSGAAFAERVRCSLFCFQPIVCCGLPLFLPNHPWQRAKCSWESSLLILLLLVLVFPEKAVFSLGFNPINFYPWEDISCLLLLFGLPLKIPGHSWRTCVGPTMSQAKIPSASVCGRSLPCWMETHQWILLPAGMRDLFASLACWC